VRELQSIIAEFERASADGAPLVLATVVHVEGSTYRRPGARLLVSEERWLAGGVSGGCLEGDLLKRAFFRTTGGVPVLVEYDSRVDADSAWTHALGCNGLVEVLLERIASDGLLHPIRTLAALLRGDEPGVLVTVFRAPASVAPPGARLVLAPDGTTFDAVGATSRAPLLAEARAALAARRSKVVRVELTGGAIEALVEVIGPPPRIVVFGEGPDVTPVVRLATTLGWRTTLVLTRHTEAVAPAEAVASEVIVCNADAIAERVRLAGASAAVLMTHAFARDRAILEPVLRSSIPYVGVLGPRRRTDKLLADVGRGCLVPAQALERIFSPVGLDLGAEEPEEIALSIVAEIQAVLRRRGAASLRTLDGPIHRSEE
jgi:xanthine dehydrogenase accessory factor